MRRQNRQKKRNNEQTQKIDSACYPLKIEEAAHWCDQSFHIKRWLPGILDEEKCLIDNKGKLHHMQTGDIVLVNPRELVSGLVRKVISTRYGIPVKSAMSHIQLVIDDEKSLSAEAGGVKFVLNNRLDHGTDVLIYRLDKMTDAKKQMLRELSEEYIGKKYAYARYMLDTTMILKFFKGLSAGFLYLAGELIGLAFLVSHSLWYGGFYILLSLSNIIWRKYDKLCYDCTEVVSELLTRAGLWIPFEKPRNEHPNGMKQVLENLCLNGGARLLGEFSVKSDEEQGKELEK